jgi:hypothetical protein
MVENIVKLKQLLNRMKSIVTQSLDMKLKIIMLYEESHFQKLGIQLIICLKHIINLKQLLSRIKKATHIVTQT